MKRFILFLSIVALGLTACNKAALDTLAPSTVTDLTGTAIVAGPLSPLDTIPQSARDYIAALVVMMMTITAAAQTLRLVPFLSLQRPIFQPIMRVIPYVKPKNTL